jgi:succinyl-CoA synthetase alpha subunit
VSILIDADTKVVVQGIGNQGTFHAQRNAAYGTQIVAGVHPKKGGRTWDELGVPVFADAVAAKEATGATATMILVPAPFAKDALTEAEEAGFDLVVCLTEGIPVHDMAVVYNRYYPRDTDGAFTREGRPVLIGPNCPGLISPGQANLGFIPGQHDARQRRPRVALGDLDLPDHARAQPGWHRHLDVRGHRRRPHHRHQLPRRDPHAG